ncbi:MAG: NAD(P)H-hydrate dehydratase [Phycisphaerales bacterium JB040]
MDPELDQSDPPTLPARAASSHKGTHGTVVVIGGHAGGEGDTRMVGAPALAGIAALRAGAGLVRLAVPEPIAGHVLEVCPSATAVALPVDVRGDLRSHEAAGVLDGVLEDAQAVVLGPGLGSGASVEQVVYRVLRGAGGGSTPVVLDADGLNAAASMGLRGGDLASPTVLTPHPGEFRRLAEGLRLSGDPTSDDERPGLCVAMARTLGCVVVLKGAGTVVSDGARAWVCRRGHPCLATGGTGDVLAGVLGGLLAQFAPSLVVGGRMPAGSVSVYDCARIGVEAHARAGEAWAREHRASAGLLATELAGLIPAELERVRG